MSATNTPVPQDPKTIYLYLSLSSGSSTIDTGLRVLERILKAQKIPFSIIDIATDEVARSVWIRRRKPTQKLPALVKDKEVLGDFTEVEEWNEYGELKQRLGLEAAPTLTQTATSSTVEKKPVDKQDKQAPPTAASILAAEAAAAAIKKKEEKK